ncbi:MAG: tRNA uridine-5-carboxymethylaminomethyl(34) synthesis enzyme MnmG [Calditrichaeota bacterium]|nr:tRNA uridine-5-carboxymethylaminomethyl(34) synthesis enzyme MnmG [Calditrichota bacterium]
MVKSQFDVIVVGGGHAGIEASLACARSGLKTLLLTMNHQTIGRMSCNPAIGGQAKGHLVREIDAMGGEMGRLIDQAGIHFKMLNRSKGPAVWSPRAQADRYLYEQIAQSTIDATRHLTVIEDIADNVLTKDNKIIGLATKKQRFKCSALILTCGTFLNGKIHIGMRNYISGRAGEEAAVGLTQSLINLGFKTGRLKTGTPPRLDIDSINWNAVEIQEADDPPNPFSFRTDKITNEQIHMYITYTNEKTHEFLKEGIPESPMYQGVINAVGPRYCPSIEDKITRFAERERHQLFLEPEGYSSKEIYVNGFSTSLPEYAQLKAIHSINGLEKARILRLGYAIEYDYFEPHQLKNTMETKLIEGLFFAGQICGTSGYEEAAAQGFIAGVNAVKRIQNESPFVLSRSESYVGVLIDDLINKSTDEPYRMFTSSAEFRLMLRQDNADIRLMKYGKGLGLIDDETYESLQRKLSIINDVNEILKTIKVPSGDFDRIKPEKMPSLKQTEYALSLLKRPEIKFDDLIKLEQFNSIAEVRPEIKAHIEFEIKYEGYIQRHLEQIDKFTKKENKKIPHNFDYNKISSLSNEAREKLNKVRPNSIGQASRISGLRPADLNILLVHVEKSMSLND